MAPRPNDPDEVRTREQAFREDRDRRVVRLPRRQFAATVLHERITERAFEVGTTIMHDDGMISWGKTRKPTPYFSPTYRIWYETRDWPLVFFQDDGTETVVTFVTDPRSSFLGRRAGLALVGLIMCLAMLGSGGWAVGTMLGVITMVLLMRVYRAADVVLDAAVQDLVPVVQSFDELSPDARQRSGASVRVRAAEGEREGDVHAQEVEHADMSERERAASSE